jgi:hypothetical protein
VDDDQDKRSVKIDKAKEIVGAIAKALGKAPVYPSFKEFKDSKSVTGMYSGNESRPDLVCCDYNLVNGEKGTEVIEGLRGKGYMSRMILYAVAIGDIEKARISESYRGVEVCKEDDELWERLTNVAYTLLLRIYDPDYIRGLVISNVSVIEKAIEEYLIAYYNIKKPDSFRNFVLRSELMSLHWKIIILSSIVKNEQAFLSETELKKLSELKNNRNDMAHGDVKIEGDTLIVSNHNAFGSSDSKRFSRDKIREILEDSDNLEAKISKTAKEMASSGKE